MLNIILDKGGLRATCRNCHEPLRYDPGVSGGALPVVLYLTRPWEHSGTGPVFLHWQCADAWRGVSPVAQWDMETVPSFLTRLLRQMGYTVDDLLVAEQAHAGNAMALPIVASTSATRDGPTEDDIREEHQAMQALADFESEHRPPPPQPLAKDDDLQDVPF